jgi:integrase
MAHLAQVLPLPIRSDGMADTGTAVQEWVGRRVRIGAITPATATNQRSTLGQFAEVMGRRDVSRIGRTDIERWLQTISHLSPGTRRNRWSTVRLFLAHMVADGKLRRNPCDQIPAPKVPRSRHRSLSHDATTALLAACPDARARCIIILGLQLGLRRAEIAGLEVGDIDWSAQTVEVTGKGGHVRVVPLTAEARRAVDAYLAESPANGGPLIRCDRYPTRPVKPAWVGRLVTAIAYNAGVKLGPRDGVSTHALRHTAATDCYQSSRDVMVVRDMLGHRDLSATATYVRGLDVGRLREQMEGRRYAA